MTRCSVLSQIFPIKRLPCRICHAHKTWCLELPVIALVCHTHDMLHSYSCGCHMQVWTTGTMGEITPVSWLCFATVIFLFFLVSQIVLLSNGFDKLEKWGWIRWIIVCRNTCIYSLPRNIICSFFLLLIQEGLATLCRWPSILLHADKWHQVLLDLNL